MSIEEKKELVAELTAKAVEITGTPSHFFTVVIQELSYDNLGVDGKTVSDIRADLHKA